MKLLTPLQNNAKTAKSDLEKYHGAILHLAPADKAGRAYNTCAGASDGCRAACLNTAGRGRFDSIQRARIRKTRWFFDDRVGFMHQLVDDVGLLVQQASKVGKIPVVRLNGTSDIPWESVLIEGFCNIFEYYPQVQFYDYTKLPLRAVGNRWLNYHLTFSKSESNQAIVRRLVNATNVNIAVVFSAELPEYYLGRPVVDGDTYGDFRFLDPQGVVVGLKAKGDARRDDSGFVVKSPSFWLNMMHEVGAGAYWFDLDENLKEFDRVS